LNLDIGVADGPKHQHLGGGSYSCFFFVLFLKHMHLIHDFPLLAEPLAIQRITRSTEADLQDVTVVRRSVFTR
jgi:hypothetical protein